MVFRFLYDTVDLVKRGVPTLAGEIRRFRNKYMLSQICNAHDDDEVMLNAYGNSPYTKFLFFLTFLVTMERQLLHELSFRSHISGNYRNATFTRNSSSFSRFW